MLQCLINNTVEYKWNLAKQRRMGKRNLHSALEGNIATGFVKDATVNHVRRLESKRWDVVLGTHNSGGMDNWVWGDKAAGSPVICSGEPVIVAEICKHQRCQLRLREPLAAVLRCGLFLLI